MFEISFHNNNLTVAPSRTSLRFYLSQAGMLLNNTLSHWNCFTFRFKIFFSYSLWKEDFGTR